ncbi:MAG: hypothetical protein ACF8XB_03160, partial [Planctomycetota bacterium JB042]
MRPRSLVVLSLALGACSDEGAPPASGFTSVSSAPPPLLRDGFEGGVLASFWRAGDAGSGRYVEGAVVVTDERARSGRSSARITVREGDVEQAGDSGERT